MPLFYTTAPQALDYGYTTVIGLATLNRESGQIQVREVHVPPEAVAHQLRAYEGHFTEQVEHIP